MLPDLYKKVMPPLMPTVMPRDPNFIDYEKEVNWQPGQDAPPGYKVTEMLGDQFLERDDAQYVPPTEEESLRRVLPPTPMPTPMPIEDGIPPGEGFIERGVEPIEGVIQPGGPADPDMRFDTMPVPYEGLPEDAIEMDIGPQPTYRDPIPYDQLMSGFAEWKRNNPDRLGGAGTMAMVPVTLPGGYQHEFTGGAPAYNFKQYLEDIGQAPYQRRTDQNMIAKLGGPMPMGEDPMMTGFDYSKETNWSPGQAAPPGYRVVNKLGDTWIEPMYPSKKEMAMLPGMAGPGNPDAGLSGQQIAEKYGIPYNQGGRVGLRFGTPEAGIKSLDAGAPDITYEGERPAKKQEMKMAGPDWYLKRIENLMYNFNMSYEEAGEIAYDSDKYFEVIGHDPYAKGPVLPSPEDPINPWTPKPTGVQMAAKGGRIGYVDGGVASMRKKLFDMGYNWMYGDNAPDDITVREIFDSEMGTWTDSSVWRPGSAQGGRIGYRFGPGPVMAQAGLPGIPRMAPDGMEYDMSQNGGFQPLGAREGKDDIKANLAKNEFVFTADAVRGAGNGDIELGAQKMYDTMKNLEKRMV